MRPLSGPILSILAALTLAPLPTVAADDEKTIGKAERSALALTVYNAGLALVRDERKVSLARGVNRIAFTDVSAQLRPETAVIGKANDSAALQVIEQNFEFDRLTPAALLRRSVGRTVRVVRTHPTTGEDRTEQAEVLSVADGVVLRIGDRIETGVPGRLVFDSLPTDLRPRPTLVALLESRAATSAPVDLSYLTGGLGWQANYVARLDEAEKQLDLTVYATIANTSGADYENARLRLAAGDVNLVGPVPMPRPQVAGAMMRAQAAPRDVPSRKAADLHLFEIERPVTLAENQSKQLTLITATGVAVEKEYRLDSMVSSGRLPDPSKPAIGVWLNLANKSEAGLGRPLPQGTLRVYQDQADGGSIFLGEDRVGHTPAGETMRLNLGRAFDLSAERTQIAYSREGLEKNVFESTFEIALRNGGVEPATVRVIERIPGQWTILSESEPHRRTSAARAEWKLKVPAGGETKLTYRVRVRR
ncbi:MAG: DUF4139 domain-containing protein [Alphaproteobacteria bacterium]|nr:DUF4139 domain-containing protein [Alphaproteobacteria bacterium]